MNEYNYQLVPISGFTVVYNFHIKNHHEAICIFKGFSKECYSQVHSKMDVCTF